MSDGTPAADTWGMRQPETSRRLSAPRVVAIGSRYGDMGLPADALVQALGLDCAVTHVAATSPLHDGLRVIRAVRRAATGGAEIVHALDARFAPFLGASRRSGQFFATASVSHRDLTSRSPWASWSRRCVGRFDHAFASDEFVLRELRHRWPALQSSLVPSAAQCLPSPDDRALRNVAHALRRVRPGRLVLGVVWPESANDLRWFRDIILPALAARPVSLIIGAPGRREALRLLAPSRGGGEFRILPGRLDGPLIAAAARCVDAFASPATGERAPHGGSTPLALALAVAGVPVVSDGRAIGRVLAHERNAFLVSRGDERGFAHTLNELLALPALQRHALGEDFGRFTLENWPWQPVADSYSEHFASIAGRPRIPASLRAA